MFGCWPSALLGQALWVVGLLLGYWAALSWIPVPVHGAGDLAPGRIVHREPLSIANSMMIYSHNVSLAEWASVYEAYYTAAMRACHGVRACHCCASRVRAPPRALYHRPLRGVDPRRGCCVPKRAARLWKAAKGTNELQKGCRCSNRLAGGCPALE